MALLLLSVLLHLMVTFAAADRLELTRILQERTLKEKAEITSTELCNELKFVEFAQELESCKLETESIIDQVRKNENSH